MKRVFSYHFTLIEIVCAIVILGFALTSLVVAVNQNMIKVITSGAAVKCVLAAENKLAEYRLKNWSEIPPTDSGFLIPEETEAFKFEMVSENNLNEYGSFVHIILKATFPASNSNKENGFVLETDVSVPLADSKKMEDAIKTASPSIKP